MWSRRQATTRLRAEQWAAPLAGAGHEVHVWTLLSERGERFLLAGGRCRALAAPLVMWRLLVLAAHLLRLRTSDVVVVQREVVPFATTLPERWVARRATLVWDVDDAVWEPTDRLVFPRRLARWRGGESKFRTTARLASQVWAGNEHLVAWAGRHCDDVRTLPTLLDGPSVVPGRGGRRDLAWVGSPATADFLRQVLPFLPQRVRVHVVGADLDQAAGPAVQCRPWSEGAEQSVLARARVGLYPIDLSHPLAEGKAAAKAGLYMAHGLPFVATPTAASAALAQDGVHCLHARTGEEWTTAVERLLTDDDLWERLAAAGRRRAEELSVSAWLPRVDGWLRAAAGGPPVA